MNPAIKQYSPSVELSEKFLRSIAISETAYEINNGYGIRKGEPLRSIDDSALGNTAGTKPLNLLITAGFTVAGIYKNPKTGLDAFISINKESGEIQIGIAGTNGFGNDSPDTKEDLIRLGASQALELYQRPEFISDLREAIESIGGMANLRNVLIAGQSLGGSVATLLGQLLVYGASKSDINISNSALIIPSDIITVVSINSPGNE